LSVSAHKCKGEMLCELHWFNY